MGGSAHYRYKVVAFQYTSTGDLTGGRDPGFCNPGETQSWTGRVLGQPDDLALAGGKGSLHILSKGTKGDVHAETQLESNFVDVEHIMVTACEGGQQTDAAFTQCTDKHEAGVSGNFEFSAGLGNRVKVEPSFYVEGQGPDGAWIDDQGFECVVPFDYTLSGATCPRQILPLSRFTAKKVRLNFSCIHFSGTPPPGTIATTFLSMAQINGFVKLKRTKQSGG